METCGKKIAGVTMEQVNTNIKMLVRWSNGERVVLEGKVAYDDYIARHADDDEDSCGRYIKDIDELSHDRQPEILKPFFEEFERIEKENGWMMLKDLFERFGV